LVVMVFVAVGHPFDIRRSDIYHCVKTIGLSDKIGLLTLD